MKSALFVDFDNVYSGLRKLDQSIADQFALKPQRWMQWLVESLAAPEHAPPGARRRVLVRRCYLNPQAFQRFRPSFNLAGFEIIDCPALTGEGKTSTDIHMVLDIIDLLQHEAHYDEFIVFSADADFTPVLRKLRRWDRRTTVLAIGFPSAAYRASADLLIDQDEFVREVLGFRDADEPSSDSEDSSDEGVVVEHALALKSVDTAVVEPDYAGVVRAAVASIQQPLACARLAQMLIDRDNTIIEDWKGTGSFRKFLESLDLKPLKIDWSTAGGRIFDPSRKASGGNQRNGKSSGASLAEWGKDAGVFPVASQTHDVTGAPLLTPDTYRALFRAIEQDVSEQSFELNQTGKRVRDRMRDAGLPVSRADATWVVRGLLLRGHQFGKGRDDAANLSKALADNVRALCLREQMTIDAPTDDAIRRWLSDGL
ncbi:MAG TPA: NYN domain-containing protein [Rhodocyclaceae bacterium]|nr:NYN domain-containing protein [Rhodocyclaceae bacterium]